MMQISPRQHGHRRAFTLIEILTVLSILVLVLALAVPAFNTLTGNNSAAVAQNQIASMISTARADAVYNRQTTGVFFYTDPASGRVAMAEVQADAQATGGYLYTPAFVSTSAGQAAYSPQYANGPITSLELVNNYNPATPANPFVYYRDQVLLPIGIGVALNNNSYGYVYNAATLPTPTPFDRYVRVGAILFDANGNLTSIPYGVQQQRQPPISIVGTFANQLGVHLGLFPANGVTLSSGDLASLVVQPAIGQPPNGFYPLTSQVGIALYDHNAYMNQHTSANDPFSDSDLEYSLPRQPLVNAADKSDEENWIDKNSTVMLVSPFNGELVKGK